MIFNLFLCAWENNGVLDFLTTLTLFEPTEQNTWIFVSNCEKTLRKLCASVFEDTAIGSSLMFLERCYLPKGNVLYRNGQPYHDVPLTIWNDRYKGGRQWGTHIYIYPRILLCNFAMVISVTKRRSHVAMNVILILDIKYFRWIQSIFTIPHINIHWLLNYYIPLISHCWTSHISIFLLVYMRSVQNFKTYICLCGKGAETRKSNEKTWKDGGGTRRKECKKIYWKCWVYRKE